MRKLLIGLLLTFLSLTIMVLFANFIYFKEDKVAIQTGEISGVSDSEFIAETVANSDMIEFSFTPKNDYAADYLLSYELQENGNTIDSADNMLVEGISWENPLTFNTTRNVESTYSLETTIIGTGESKRTLHSDKIVINAREIKNKR